MRASIFLLTVLTAQVFAKDRGHSRGDNRRELKKAKKGGKKGSQLRGDVFSFSQGSMGTGMGMGTTIAGMNGGGSTGIMNGGIQSGLQSGLQSGTQGGLQSGMQNGAQNGMQSETLTLSITNLSFNQPFSPFFVMVHNTNAQQLYAFGQPPSGPLALLAENGDPAPLVSFYNETNVGVSSVSAFSQGAPYLGGEALQFQVTVTDEFPLVTIASMAINTNDCFTSLNGLPLQRGMVLDVPGVDAGSEENNERCMSIPGPGCASMSTLNVRSGNGEGFVHVHRGFFGIGDLPADRYDWRNPMMRVVVS